MEYQLNHFYRYTESGLDSIVYYRGDYYANIGAFLDGTNTGYWVFPNHSVSNPIEYTYAQVMSLLEKSINNLNNSINTHKANLSLEYQRLEYYKEDLQNTMYAIRKAYYDKKIEFKKLPNL